MRTLSSFEDIHKAQSIVVSGCGESLNDFHNPERFITIGVNDVGRGASGRRTVTRTASVSPATSNGAIDRKQPKNCSRKPTW